MYNTTSTFSKSPFVILLGPFLNTLSHLNVSSKCYAESSVHQGTPWVGSSSG